jgi:hypothetical protein
MLTTDRIKADYHSPLHQLRIHRCTNSADRPGSFGGSEGRLETDQHLLLPASKSSGLGFEIDSNGSFRSDIFLLIGDHRANRHRSAATHDREICDISGRKKPDPIVQI